MSLKPHCNNPMTHEGFQRENIFLRGHSTKHKKFYGKKDLKHNY